MLFLYFFLLVKTIGAFRRLDNEPATSLIGRRGGKAAQFDDKAIGSSNSTCSTQSGWAS